jgi:hypothetical protein
LTTRFKTTKIPPLFRVWLLGFEESKGNMEGGTTMKRREIEALAARLLARSTSKLACDGPEIRHDLRTAAALIQLMAVITPGIEVDVAPPRAANSEKPAAGGDLPATANAGSLYEALPVKRFFRPSTFFDSDSAVTLTASASLHSWQRQPLLLGPRRAVNPRLPVRVAPSGARG